MIICICRGKSDRDVARAIEGGATNLLGLQRCGIGDQCGSCHSSLRSLIARAAASDAAAQPCPACDPAPAPVPLSAMA